MTVSPTFYPTSAFDFNLLAFAWAAAVSGATEASAINAVCVIGVLVFTRETEQLISALGK
jgi:hypothetical protein